MNHVLAGGGCLLLAAAVLAACQPAPLSPAASSTSNKQRAIAVGERPEAIAASGGFIYASDPAKKAIAVIDSKSDTLATTLAIDGCTPGDLRAFLDRSAVLVVDTARGEGIVLNPDNNHAIAQRVPLGTNPGALAIADDNAHVAVALGGLAGGVQLTFHDDRSKPAAFKPLADAATLGTTSTLDYRGGQVVVGGAGGFKLVDPEKGTVTKIAEGGRGGPVALHALEGKATMAVLGDVEGDRIVLYDLANKQQTVLADAGKGPRDIAIDPEYRLAYVAMSGSDEVTIVDLATKAVAARVPAGKTPSNVQMAPPTLHEVWAGAEDGTLTAIDGTTKRMRKQLQIGLGAHRFTYWGLRGYATNAADGTVSIIDRTEIR